MALVADGEVIAERVAGPDAGGRPRHATALLATVEDVLAVGGGWDAVARIAVGIGPGAFTGLRIGISTARALTQSRELGLAGVSSLASLAAGVDSAQTRLAVLDAKRGEAFAALYDPAGAELWPAWVGPPDELADRNRAGVERPDPLGAGPVAVGDGSVRFRDQLESAGALVPADGEEMHRPRARHLCRLADGVPDSREIEPDYLRRPDAELWRERDHRPPNG